jgi:hypothetical protein
MRIRAPQRSLFVTIASLGTVVFICPFFAGYELISNSAPSLLNTETKT